MSSAYAEPLVMAFASQGSMHATAPGHYSILIYIFPLQPSTPLSRPVVPVSEISAHVPASPLLPAFSQPTILPPKQTIFAPFPFSAPPLPGAKMKTIHHAGWLTDPPQHGPPGPPHPLCVHVNASEALA